MCPLVRSWRRPTAVAPDCAEARAAPARRQAAAQQEVEQRRQERRRQRPVLGDWIGRCQFPFRRTPVKQVRTLFSNVTSAKLSQRFSASQQWEPPGNPKFNPYLWLICPSQTPPTTPCLRRPLVTTSRSGDREARPDLDHLVLGQHDLPAGGGCRRGSTAAAPLLTTGTSAASGTAPATAPNGPRPLEAPVAGVRVGVAPSTTSACPRSPVGTLLCVVDGCLELFAAQPALDVEQTPVSQPHGGTGDCRCTSWPVESYGPSCRCWVGQTCAQTPNGAGGPDPVRVAWRWNAST